MRWLILFTLLVSVGCTNFNNEGATTRQQFFTVDHQTALAGDEIVLSWNTTQDDVVSVEVWGFASYAAPQVQKIAEYTNLPAAGTQSITMPDSPSGAYLIVDHNIDRDQPPNMTVELNPTFYQTTVHQFEANQTCARRGDEVIVNWDTDSEFPLSIQTQLIHQTTTSTYVEDNTGEEYENLPPVGSLSLVIPDYAPEVVQMGFNLSFSHNTYTGFVAQTSIDLTNCP